MPARPWQSYAEDALGELGEAEEAKNADACDEHLQRAAVYALLAIAAAVAEDGWGHQG